MRIGPIFLVFACSGHPYEPGSPIGTFQATGALTVATCGGDAPNPWSFATKLSRDSNTLYWNQDTAIMSGAIDASGSATLKASNSNLIHPASSTQGSCSVTRSDTLSVQLSTANDAFSGSVHYAYTIDDGSDCLDQIGTTFTALPCDIEYTLTATRTSTTY